MISKDAVPWSAGLLGATAAAPTNGRGAAAVGGASTPGAAASAGGGGAGNSFPFLAPSGLVQGTANGTSASPSGILPSTLTHERSQELCKYFLNGGCLRGAQCQYLHELPDERHLDVNGFGYILNPNVHNAQKTVPLALNCGVSSAVQVNSGVSGSSPLMVNLGSTSSRQSHGSKGKHQTPFVDNVQGHLSFQMSAPTAKLPPPKYRPPEPFLEYNLPPTLALPFNTPAKDVATQLTRTMLQN